MYSYWEKILKFVNKTRISFGKEDGLCYGYQVNDCI